MTRPCAINPACTVKRPDHCRAGWRAHCERLAAWRASLTAEQFSAWCEEDDRAFAEEAMFDASGTVMASSAPDVLIAREVLGAVPAAEAPARRYGLGFHVRTSPEIEDEVVARYHAGSTVECIAGELGLSVATVSRVLGRRGARRPRRAA